MTPVMRRRPRLRPAALAAVVALLSVGAGTAMSMEIDVPPKARHAAFAEPHCGIFRVAVKTLTDPAADRISTGPSRATIAQLTALPAPSPLQVRIAPAETQTWQLAGVTIEAVHHQADGDLHVVVGDPTGRTMITELPAPRCLTDTPPHFAARIEAARAALASAADGQPSRLVGATATLQGVGFFDELHGQLGVAPNGIELHPVTSFRLDAAGT